MKNKKDHTVGTVPKLNRKNISTCTWLLTFLYWYVHFNKKWRGYSFKHCKIIFNAAVLSIKLQVRLHVENIAIKALMFLHLYLFSDLSWPYFPLYILLIIEVCYHDYSILQGDLLWVFFGGELIFFASGF